MALLMTTGIGIALGATQFTGKLQEVTITDAAKSNVPPVPVLKYTLKDNAVTVDASGSYDTDGSITQYNWDFGDGAKATGVTANHQYAASGNYPLTLTIVDNAGGAGIVQQQLDLSTQSTLFYWSVDKLPEAASILSDIGNVPITRASKDAASVPGFKGNCMQQTGVQQYYKIPMTAVPGAKGTLRMYVRHDMPPASTDTTNRYFFGSTNEARPNSLYAYTYRGYIYFYLYDSAGTLHRAYVETTWQEGTWYLYEFNWDAANGSLAIKRDGTVLKQTADQNWLSAIPSWAGQDLDFGNVNPIGSIDEIYITD